MHDVTLAAAAAWGRDRRSLSGIAWGLLAALTTLLLLRRLAGVFVQPLGAGEFILAALAIVVLRATAEPAPGGVRRSWQASAAAAVALGCLTLRGTPWGGLIVGWSIWMLAESWHGVPAVRLRCAHAARALTRRLHSDRRGAAGRRPLDAAAAEQELRQELRRFVDPQGRHVVHARLVEPLSAGQLTVTLHVAIAPPLPGTPSVQWEQVAGPPARWSAPLTLPHGVRLEGKLASPAESGECVEIELQATSAAH